TRQNPAARAAGFSASIAHGDRFDFQKPFLIEDVCDDDGECGSEIAKDRIAYFAVLKSMLPIGQKNRHLCEVRKAHICGLQLSLDVVPNLQALLPKTFGKAAVRGLRNLTADKQNPLCADNLKP